VRRVAVEVFIPFGKLRAGSFGKLRAGSFGKLRAGSFGKPAW
jgi:hypothetical protein